MIGCDVSLSENDKHYFTVSFYDENLDLDGQTKVDVLSPTIDIAQLKIDLGLSASSLYRGGSEDNVSGETSYPITGDTNFYFDLNVTEITTQAELADINATAATLGGKYMLLKDIALDKSGAGFEPTYGWKPMGDSSNSFTGIFNGNRHKITGLWIDRPSTDGVGLFGYADGAMIKNIGVEIPNGETVKGRQYVGGIVGYVADSSITNSYSTGDISGASGNVGGIVGYVANGSITNSYATGDISGASSSVGGIAGYAIGDITNSYATGDISGNQFAGGIAGYTNYGTITNSYATGHISGFQNVGGIVGSASGGDINNSAAINPSVSANSGNVDKIVGYINGSPTINNNFALSTMSITPSGSGNGGDADKPYTDFKTRSTYETGLGWKFGNNDSSPWKIDANKNGGLPYLYWENR
jgi:hypothetical protein